VLVAKLYIYHKKGIQMKFQTKRNLQATILMILLTIAIFVIDGFNNVGDFITKAFVCFIFSGIIIVIWEELIKNKGKSVSTNKFIDGIESFDKGLEYYQNEDFQNALVYFNKAIENDCKENIYSYRADCLFELGLNQQAIQDYNKAISQEPDDCNLWYMRSQVKNIISDFKGEIEDLETAIRLSKIESRLNKEYFNEMQERGWENGHTSLYQNCLLSKQLEQKRNKIHIIS